MKKVQVLLIVAVLMLMPGFAKANDFLPELQKDTVIITLANGSRIIIYTKNKVELKRLQAYDINEMIRDLNESVQDSDVDYLEIENESGEKYLLQDAEKVFETGDGDQAVVSKENMEKVRIKVGGMELLVEPDEFEDEDEDNEIETREYKIVKEETDRTQHYFNVDIGINNWLSNGNAPNADNAAYSVKPWGSWYVGLGWKNRTWVGGPLFIEWGADFSWYNWKLEDPDFQIIKGDERVEFVESPNEISGQKSKLRATYVNASFVPMLDFGKGRKRVKKISSDGFKLKTYRESGFRIGAGVYAGYRLGSKTKFVFKEDGEKDRRKQADHFYLENFRYGVRAQLRFRSFDMFFTYDLNEVFVDGRGPDGVDLNAYTIGVTF